MYIFPNTLFTWTTVLTWTIAASSSGSTKKETRTLRCLSQSSNTTSYPFKLNSVKIPTRSPTTYSVPSFSLDTSYKPPKSFKPSLDTIQFLMDIRNSIQAGIWVAISRHTSIEVRLLYFIFFEKLSQKYESFEYSFNIDLLGIDINSPSKSISPSLPAHIAESVFV